MVGERLSHYTIQGQLGAGGMGVVYRAWDESLKRDVAIKLLPPAASAGTEIDSRFEREALALSRLNHPNICTVYEVGREKGRVYIVMEFIDGRQLTDLIPASGLPIETAVRYGVQLTEALSHAHGHGLLHRDLKSSNVMVTGEDRLKLVDFGLAKRSETEACEETITSETVTGAGVIVGTIAYMPPEVLRGEPGDARSEVWSAGVVLHEMIAGARPFRKTESRDLCSAILQDPAAPLPERTPLGIRGIIHKCLAKEPSQRYQSATELRSALEAVSLDTIYGGKLQPRLRRWAAAAAALAVVGAGGAYFQRSQAPVSFDSVAVLPFENLSRDADQEFFADGMTEQLITDLSKIRALRVISRTSVMRYRGKNRLPLPQIARELGVDAVVEGSVMRSADKVRVTAQLIDARGDQHLWAESYDRDLSEVLVLQRDLARTIANEIRITVTPVEQARLSTRKRVSPEVHQLVLRGQYYANKGTESDLRKGLDYFEQAAAKDPEYAQAHAGVAFVYRQLSNVHLSPRETMPKARAAAERALALDETLPEAHVQLGAVMLFYEWDWEKAQKHIKRALELNPSSADARLLYANYLTTSGQPKLGLAELRRARALDPLSVPVHVALLFGLIGSRQYDETIEHSRKLLEREPRFALAHVTAALALGEKGEFDLALKEIEAATKIASGPLFTAMAGHVHAAKGNKREARKLLAQLKEMSSHRYVCAYEVAHVYVKMGDKKQAYEWLEKGRRDRADCMVWLAAEPWMDPLRNDPEYHSLVRAIGLGTGAAGEKP